MYVMVPEAVHTTGLQDQRPLPVFFIFRRQMVCLHVC